MGIGLKMPIFTKGLGLRMGWASSRGWDRLIGLVVTLLFLLMGLKGLFHFTENLENKAYDLVIRMAASSDRVPQVELVSITEEDLAQLESIHLPRHILAKGIENLARAGSKVIALDITLTEPEVSPGLRAVRRLKEDYDKSGLAQEGAGLAFLKKLSDTLAEMDHDAALYKAIEEAGNVVLPVTFDFRKDARDTKAPAYIVRDAFRLKEGVGQQSLARVPVQFSKIHPIASDFGEVAAGVGHNNIIPDPDGVVRRYAHVVRYLDEIYLPSFPLAILRVFWGLEGQDTMLSLDGDIKLRTSKKEVRIPVVDRGRQTLIKWRQGPNVAFHQTPFTQVLRNEFFDDVFRGKIVILGPASVGSSEEWMSPLSRRLSDMEIAANAVADILNNSYIVRPPWAHLLETAILLLSGVFLIFILPNFNVLRGALTTLGLCMSYMVLGTLLLVISSIWLKILSPVVMLSLGFILLALRRFITASANRVNGEELKAAPAVPEKNRSRMGFSGTAASKEIYESPDLNHSRGEPVPNQGKPALEKYELLEEIGRGSSGIVYQGYDPKEQKTVAIKVVRLSQLDPEKADDIRARFFRCAATVSLLNHPNIVTILDWGEEKDVLFMVMAYPGGDDAGKYTQRGRLLPARTVLSVIARAAKALAYAHEKGVFHQNLKPSNIVGIGAGGRVGVTDFGMEQTPAYMSPEQVSGKMADGRSDIFSLGVILFEMLAGRRPFEEKDITSLLFKITKEKAPSIKTYKPNMPAVVEKIIGKALEKDVKERYQRAADMADHLCKVVAKIDAVQAREKA